MSPERAALDRALARKGEIIIVRRYTSTLVTWFDVECRAFVRGYTPQELIGGISQTDSLVTISPTEIFATQWPGGQSPGSSVDPRIPRKNDRVIIQGRVRNIESVGPFFVASELVRIEMRVIG